MFASWPACPWGRRRSSWSRKQGAAFATCKGKPDDADPAMRFCVIQGCGGRVAGIYGLFGQIEDGGGRFASWVIVESCGLARITCWSTCEAEQVISTRPWRIGPCASCVANTEAPRWFAHAAQKRKPSSREPG